MVKATKPRAAIYTRISGQSDDRRFSLETQAEACIQKARELGYEAGQADVFEDQWTGSELGRPSLAVLRAKAREGEYSAVVFYELDRLSRNQAHIYILLDEFERHNVKLEGVKDTVDSSPLGKLVMSIKAFVAEIEREKIRDRCERGKSKKLASGKIICSGTPRYGYAFDMEAGRYVRDAATAPVVERLFHLIGSEGYSMRRATRTLVDDGVPPPGVRRKNGQGDGRNWSVTTVSKMIRDEVYIGVYAWGKTKTDGTRKNGQLTQTKVTDRGKWRQLDGCADPIVSEELWLAANARVSSGTLDRNRIHKIPRLLSGRIFCMACGGRMVSTSSRASSNGTVHGYYICSSSHENSSTVSSTKKERCGGKNVACSFIHDAVWAGVVALKNDPQSLAARIEQAVQNTDDVALRASLASLEQDAEKKDKIIAMLRSKWAAAIDAGDADFAVIVESQLKTSISAAKKVRQACNEISSQIESSVTSATAVRDIAAKVAMSKAFVENAAFSDKRLLIDSLGVRVDASGRDFKVTIDVFAGPQPYSTRELQNYKLLRLDVTAIYAVS